MVWGLLSRREQKNGESLQFGIVEPDVYPRDAWKVGSIHSSSHRTLFTLRMSSPVMARTWAPRPPTLEWPEKFFSWLLYVKTPIRTALVEQRASIDQSPRTTRISHCVRFPLISTASFYFRRRRVPCLKEHVNMQHVWSQRLPAGFLIHSQPKRNCVGNTIQTKVGTLIERQWLQIVPRRWLGSDNMNSDVFTTYMLGHHSFWSFVGSTARWDPRVLRRYEQHEATGCCFQHPPRQH